jgi:hypothetical protein
LCFLQSGGQWQSFKKFGGIFAMRVDDLTDASRPAFEAQMRRRGIQDVWLQRRGAGYAFLEVSDKWQLWCAALAYGNDQRQEFKR